MNGVLTLDSRRRANFSKFGQPEHRLYHAETKPDGTIVLTPVVVVPLAKVPA